MVERGAGQSIFHEQQNWHAPETKKFKTEKQPETLENKTLRLKTILDHQRSLDSANPKITALLRQPEYSDLQKGKAAEKSFQIAVKRLYAEKNIIPFRYLAAAPPSTDIFNDKMDLIALLPSGKPLGIQLFVHGYDKADWAQTAEKKRISAAKYGIREPETIPGFSMPRAYAEIDEDFFDSYEMQQKSPTVLVRAVIDSVIENLDPMDRIALARHYNFREPSHQEEDLLRSYCEELISIRSKIR